MSTEDEQRAAAERPVVLRVRRRCIVHARGDCDESVTLYCPQTALTHTLEHCTKCPRFLGLEDSGGAVRCWVDCTKAGQTWTNKLPLPEALERTSVGTIPLGGCTCLDPELDAVEASTILKAEHQSSAPVVDDSGVLVGNVATQALVQLGLEERSRHGFDFGATPAEVEDAMSTVVVAVWETASVGEAVRLMARSGLERLPIVTPNAEVVGAISTMDLVRWLADRIAR